MFLRAHSSGPRPADPTDAPVTGPDALALFAIVELHSASWAPQKWPPAGVSCPGMLTTQEPAAGRWRLALAAATLAVILLAACAGKLAVLNKPPGMEAPPEHRTHADCRAIKGPRECEQTAGCHYRWVDICVPLWRLKQAEWNPLEPGRLDPYGVQIDLINRRRAELHAVASGRIGCFPKRPTADRQRGKSPR